MYTTWILLDLTDWRANSTYRELGLRAREYLQYLNAGGEKQYLAEVTMYTSHGHNLSFWEASHGGLVGNRGKETPRTAIASARATSRVYNLSLIKSLKS